MSILASQTQPAPTREQRIQAKAEAILNAPAEMVGGMYRQWNQNFDAMWRTDDLPGGDICTPADKLAAMGTNAIELLNLNAAFTTFMITQLTGKRDDLVAAMQTKVATLPAITVNTDGSAVLTSSK